MGHCLIAVTTLASGLYFSDSMASRPRVFDFDAYRLIMMSFVDSTGHLAGLKSIVNVNYDLRLR